VSGIKSPGVVVEGVVEEGIVERTLVRVPVLNDRALPVGDRTLLVGTATVLPTVLTPVLVGVGLPVVRLFLGGFAVGRFVCDPELCVAARKTEGQDAKNEEPPCVGQRRRKKSFDMCHGRPPPIVS
jgi:hypothetical protein